MKKLLLISVLTLTVVLFGSCTHRLTDFTVISTKNVPLGVEATHLKKADSRVKGVDRAHRILFIPLGTPNMKEAIDKAIHKYPGCVGLADGVVKSNFWTALLYGQNSYIVEGTPLYVEDVSKQSNNVVYSIQSSEEVKSDNEKAAILFFHEVKQGEKLSEIADNYGVKVTDIIKWNELSNSTVNKGDKLKIYLKE